jgi:3-dehydroquinate synthase
MVDPFWVRHSGGEYPVLFGAGISATLPTLLAELLPAHRPIVIADETVSNFLPAVLPEAERVTFPAGESHKTRTTWSELTDRLLASGIDRRTVVVALGGGVTTDLAGFVAAVTLRGLPWLAVPTTTLAMLDAAVGGKTGVDTVHGKNLVGAFHQPTAVVVDPQLLDTLPDDVFVDGLAEAVKHAAIGDRMLWEWFETNATRILSRDTSVLTELVRRSIAIKASVVSDDEREQGRRTVLNAGHTVAHALEHATGFALSHGQAVAIGLVRETHHGEALGITEPGTAARLAQLLTTLGLPAAVPTDLDRERFHAALQHDKKNRDGDVHCCLIARLGEVARAPDGGWTQAVSAEALLAQT